MLPSKLLLPRAFVVLFQFLDLFAIGKFGHGAHAVQEEDSVEVVVFVLDDAGGEFGEAFREGLAVLVDGFDAEGGEAGDFDADIGQGEAAFFERLGRALGGRQLGVDVELGAAGCGGGVGVGRAAIGVGRGARANGARSADTGCRCCPSPSRAPSC